jgi:hypothetical protein
MTYRVTVTDAALARIQAALVAMGWERIEVAATENRSELIREG